ncbi:hypothetical protein [Paludibacterium paludis]|uniref:hypothetical protein n=1 Tax=Paludibacterium paludis TaxID=1225769 RepID=UPI001677A9B3|nr:hypothetical protein [Paludibacterium paludis]
MHRTRERISSVRRQGQALRALRGLDGSGGGCNERFLDGHGADGAASNLSMSVLATM